MVINFWYIIIPILYVGAGVLTYVIGTGYLANEGDEWMPIGLYRTEFLILCIFIWWAILSTTLFLGLWEFVIYPIFGFMKIPLDLLSSKVKGIFVIFNKVPIESKNLNSAQFRWHEVEFIREGLTPVDRVIAEKD